MENWPINPVDTFVIAAVLLSGILALIRGLVREVLSLASWSIAFYAGMKLAPYGKTWGLKLSHNETVAMAIGGFIIFFLVLLVLTIISHYIAKIVRESALSTIDRSLGFAFGALRGFLVAVLVYLGGIMLFSAEDQPTWLKDAQTEPALRASAEWVQSLMPEDMKKQLDKSIGIGQKTDKDKADNLDRLSTPTPEGTAPAVAPADGTKPTSGLDEDTKAQLRGLIIKKVMGNEAVQDQTAAALNAPAPTVAQPVAKPAVQPFH